MGRFAMGIRALGKSFGLELKGLSDSPGPQSIKAWKPVGAIVACGMLVSGAPVVHATHSKSASRSCSLRNLDVSDVCQASA